MKEPKVHVGILFEPQIEFILLNLYRINGMEISGKQVVTYNEGRILWNGRLYDELLFEPVNETTDAFELLDVTIGINFHWERKEDQRFLGSLKIIVENKKLTGINVIHVEDYLTSVISSEMSATASLELLKAHAVISRSWLLAIDNSQLTIHNPMQHDSAANCQLSTVNFQLKKGQEIMIQSFRTIESELKNKSIPLDHKWALLHAIHTTADFEMEKLLYTDKGAVEKLYQKIADGRLKTIVTDVTMAASGIRKGALQRLGVEVKCYLSDERIAAMAAEKGITRTQAGIRLAVEEHPDALFVFGNAPTALMELCDLVRKGKAAPSGIIAAPVGFVHVQESKHMVKPFMEIPKLIVEGRKGGSNLAATLVNAILCYNDAEQLRPGRDV